MPRLTVETISTPEGYDFIRSDGRRFHLVSKVAGHAVLYVGQRNAPGAQRGRMKYPELVEMFVKDGAAKQVNLSAPHRAAFVSAVKRAVESKDSQDHSQDLKACESALADAVKEIEDVVEKDTVRRFKPSKEAQYDQQIAQVSQKIAPFEAQLQKLGARLKVLQDQKKKLAA